MKCSEHMVIPLFEQRCKEYDELVASELAMRSLARLSITFIKPPGDSPSPSPLEGKLIMVYGMNAAAVTAAMDEARAYINNQYKHSAAVAIPASVSTPDQIEAFKAAIQDTIASLNAWIDVRVATRSPRLTVTVIALGELALLKAADRVNRHIIRLLSKEFETQPPEWWDDEIASYVV